MSALRENWRIVMLSTFLVVSGIVMFAPGLGAATGPTNLQYGLDLEGGTRVRAPPAGMYAEQVDLGGINNESGFEARLANELNISGADVNAVIPPDSDVRAVELYTTNVTESQFQSALSSVGVDVSTDQIKPGVSKPTREALVRTLRQKISQGGLAGGTVTQLSGDDRTFIVVEVPGANRSEVINTVQDRGLVEIVAQVKNENGTVTANETLLTGEDITVGSVRPRTDNPDGPYEVGVTINNDQAARRFSQQMVQLGFTDDGVSNCDRGNRSNSKSGSYCLLTVLDGRVIHDNGLAPSLAKNFENGDFVQRPAFTIGAPNSEVAEDVRIGLQVGSLPTTLAVEEQGTAYYISPSLAGEFKLFALITGLIAWLGVSLVVFVRYKKARVAIPMLFTAAAEVFILLAFAVLVGLRVDLSHIAGFIAVIGTGVDDLIIIADEILQQGEVATGRVFQSRFRKAFWVIGAAAATTIIAMSPLAVLSLGDLQGFAVVTIAGVLIGVLITRPAYGDILRNLVLGENQSGG